MPVTKVNTSDPMFETEVEYKMSREKAEMLTKEYQNVRKREDAHAFDLRNKYRALMEKHVDAYNREYRIKFSNDNQLAVSEL